MLLLRRKHTRGRGNMTKRPVLIINSEENDDWMKTLPGYKDEVEIIESLAKKKKAKLTFNKQG